MLTENNTIPNFPIINQLNFNFTQTLQKLNSVNTTGKGIKLLFKSR